MFRSEVMLLLVTLALLGTPTFGAQKFYGSTVGTHFCTAPPSGEDITAIRMNKLGVRLLSVQVKNGETWSDVYGAQRGTREEFTLNPGEYFTWVYGSYVTDIRSLVLYTDWGRNFMIGQRAGQEFTVFPDKQGQVLKGICGFYNNAGLKSLLFEWGDPNSASNSTSECK